MRPTGMTRRFRAGLGALAILGLFLLSCTRGGGGALTDVSGMVTAGPTCPVETDPPNPACAERPVAGAKLVILDQDGIEVARTTAGEDGTFTIQLAPGSYRLVPQRVDGLMGTAEPVDFIVKAGHPVTDLQVSYDTGIR